MNFPMFFCSWEEGKDFGFHEAILDETAWLGFGIALATGIIIAILYYVIVGKSARMANLLTWFIALVVALVANFVISDQILVGQPVDKKAGVNQESMTYKYSFFQAIDKHTKELCESKKYKDNDDAKEKINKYARKLTKETKEGITTFPLFYEINCLFWTLLFFVLTSYGVKNMTEQAQGVPTYWPAKSH